MVSRKVKSILIAEDEKSYSGALVLKLQHAGYEAMSVENGEEALEFLKNKSIDLFILDLIMPKMNGFTVLEEMKKRKINIPTIVVSNLSQIDDEKKGKLILLFNFYEMCAILKTYENKTSVTWFVFFRSTRHSFYRNGCI